MSFGYKNYMVCFIIWFVIGDYLEVARIVK